MIELPFGGEAEGLPVPQPLVELVIPEHAWVSWATYPTDGHMAHPVSHITCACGMQVVIHGYQIHAGELTHLGCPKDKGMVSSSSWSVEISESTFQKVISSERINLRAGESLHVNTGTITVTST